MTFDRDAGQFLRTLTELNRRVLAAEADEDTSTAEQTAAPPSENTILPGGGTGYRTFDEDGPAREEVRGRFSVEDPLEFNRVKEWLEANVFGGTATGMTPLINAFVNEWDVEWRRQQAAGDDAQLSQLRNPTLEDLLDEDGFLNGAIWLPLTANQALPPVFESTVEAEDGTEAVAIATASPLTGVEFIEVTEDLAALKARPKTMWEVVRRTGTDLIRRAQGGGVGTDDATARAAAELTRQPDVPGESRLDRGAARRAQGLPTAPAKKLNLPDYVKSAILYSDPAAEGRTAAPPLPVIPQQDVVRQLIDATTRGGGGGGGGSRTIRSIEFDRDHLLSQVADRWNRWMLSADEAPMGQIGSWVDAYIRDAKSFWADKSTQLDFDTYITNRMQKHPRYQTIYKDKLPGESEEQYVQKFMGPVASLGQTGEFTRAQTLRSIESGGTPASQFERVSRTRPVQVANQGSFSQRYAKTLAGIGVG